MKIQITSDLHTEFYNDPHLFDFIKKTDADILFILGDLGIPYLSSYETTIKECSESYKTTIIISGNHEGYQHKNITPITLEETKTLIKKIISKYTNVHYLDNDVYELNDEYVILGTTLWSYIPQKEYKYVKEGMNDFKYVYYFNEETQQKEKINDKYINNINKNNVKWLTEKIDEYNTKKIIILSHHLPSYKMIAPQYLNDPYTCCFVNSIDKIITNNIKYWFCGHTHSNIDVTINGCRCIVNPHGYPHENSSYIYDYIIDINENLIDNNIDV